MNIPLVIDVDGTLFNGDFSHELLLLGITKSPLNAYNFIKQGLASKPQLKAKLADMLGPDLDISNLPYNETVIKYAKQYKANGGDVVLCSGSDNSIIQRIVMHFDWIDVGYGSTKERNLTNTVKRDFLKQLYPDGYAYIGNSKQDYSVWEGADKALAIAPPFGVKHIRTRNGEAVDILEPKSNSVSAALKSMRLHQWAKNALIFLVPALTIEELTYVDISNLLFGFLVMGFLASGTYIFNDLIDIQNDRQHANKKKRPFAKGTLNIPKGLALMIGCLFLALAATIFLPKFFAITLCAYFFITISYSVFLKRVPIVDVLTLALLFTIRVIAGATIVQEQTSPWLVSFVITFFLSLALAKRHTELVKLKNVGMPGRGYKKSDTLLVLSFGMMATALAIMSFILYALIADEPVLASSMSVIISGFLLTYWIMRIWLLSHRGKLNDDPVLFAVKDPLSIALAGLLFVVVTIEQIGSDIAVLF